MWKAGINPLPLLNDTIADSSFSRKHFKIRNRLDGLDQIGHQQRSKDAPPLIPLETTISKTRPHRHEGAVEQSQTAFNTPADATKAVSP